MSVYLCDHQDDQTQWQNSVGMAPGDTTGGITTMSTDVGFATTNISWEQPATEPFYAEAHLWLEPGATADQWVMFKVDAPQGVNNGYNDNGNGFAMRPNGDWFSFTNTGLTGTRATPPSSFATAVLLGLHKKSPTDLDLYIDRVLVGAHPAPQAYGHTPYVTLWEFNTLVVRLDRLAIASTVPAPGADICAESVIGKWAWAGVT